MQCRYIEYDNLSAVEITCVKTTQICCRLSLPTSFNETESAAVFEYCKRGPSPPAPSETVKFLLNTQQSSICHFLCRVWSPSLPEVLFSVNFFETTASGLAAACFPGSKQCTATVCVVALHLQLMKITHICTLVCVFTPSFIHRQFLITGWGVYGWVASVCLGWFSNKLQVYVKLSSPFGVVSWTSLGFVISFPILFACTGWMNHRLTLT